jgi:glycosyltransferase involved in cell wall biosynthesis
VVPDWSALRTSLRWPEYFAPGLLRRLRRLRADVVICMGRNANCYGFWIKRNLPRVRLVTTYRTNRHLPWFYRKSIFLSDLCLTNSHWAGDELGRMLPGRASGLVATIPNALIREHVFSLERDEAARAAARRRLDLPERRMIGLNTSHFVPGKNQAALLQWLNEARRKEPQWLLLLAGEGPERVKCQQLAQQLGLGDHVRFLGCVEAVEPLLQAADLYLSTSLREGLPNALVEAQAAGLPVVTFNTAGSRETLANGKSGYVTPVADMDAFAAAVEELRTNPSKRSAFSAYAREFAQEHFDPAGIRAKYCGLLRNL